MELHLYSPHMPSWNGQQQLSFTCYLIILLWCIKIWLGQFSLARYKFLISVLLRSQLFGFNVLLLDRWFLTF